MSFTLFLAMVLPVVVHGGVPGVSEEPSIAPSPMPTPITTLTPPPADEPSATTPTFVSPEPTTIPPTVVTPEPSTTPPTVVTPEPSTTPPTVVTPEPTTTPPTVVTPEPTTIPPTVVTEIPTVTPTVATPEPTTIPPTVVTEMPTTEPPVETVIPTATPTTEPPAPTAAPTTPPTDAPSKAPVPTPAPTQMGSQVDPKTFPNLSQSMSGVDPLNDSSWMTYEETYMEFVTLFYRANPDYGVTNVEIKLEFVSQDPPLSSRRLGEKRRLQDQLNIVFNQAITYAITPNSSLSTAEVVTQPFAAQQSRDAFAQLLQNSGDAAFANIEGVSGLSQSNPAPAGDGGLSTGAIIGIAVGGAAGAALLIGGGYWLYKRNHSGGYAKDVGDQPPSSLNLGGGDDVSTLQDPARDHKMSTYGDQR